jgi:predicted SnoaL-like aldol condensation-catalyzing enzyme
MNKSNQSIIVKAAFILVIVFYNIRSNHVLAGNLVYNSHNKQTTQISDNQKQEEINKKLVADFYQQLFGDKDVSAIDKYIGDVYIQHNPAAADGKEALKLVVSEWFKNAPKEKIDIQHLGADGNFVYIHTKAKWGTKVVSVIDIFRIENGKIVEHWDVMQEVPEKSANDHPMF